MELIASDSSEPFHLSMTRANQGPLEVPPSELLANLLDILQCRSASSAFPRILENNFIVTPSGRENGVSRNLGVEEFPKVKGFFIEKTYT